MLFIYFVINKVSESLLTFFYLDELINAYGLSTLVSLDTKLHKFFFLKTLLIYTIIKSIQNESATFGKCREHEDIYPLRRYSYC